MLPIGAYFSIRTHPLVYRLSHIGTVNSGSWAPLEDGVGIAALAIYKP